jgi:hypothetical protein
VSTHWVPHGVESAPQSEQSRPPSAIVTQHPPKAEAALVTGHPLTQLPWKQICPASQAWAHAPQFARSVVVSTQ